MTRAGDVAALPGPWPDGEWVPIARLVEPDAATRWHTYCEGGCGVYRLVALKDAASREPAVVARICGGDPSGTLYIGQSSNLHMRLSALIRTHHPAYVAAIYADFPAVLERMYPPETLGVTWESHPDALSAQVRETQLLRSYVARFGERPPRNGQGGSP